MGATKFLHSPAVRWAFIFLTAIPSLYVLDLLKTAIAGFVKFGWDSRPFVSIQIQSAVAFVSYSAAISLASVAAGILSRNRLFTWAALAAVVPLGCFALGVATWSFGILVPKH